MDTPQSLNLSAHLEALHDLRVHILMFNSLLHSCTTYVILLASTTACFAKLNVCINHVVRLEVDPVLSHTNDERDSLR